MTEHEMSEHDRNDSGATYPSDELEPIDLDALFGGELDDRLDGAGEEDAAEEQDADALLLSRLFAADLADEPVSDLSTADILSAARAGADPAGVGASRATTADVTDSTSRPAPSDHTDRPDSADDARRSPLDELAVRRRRRTLVSRSLLAAAAVAVLALGTVAVVNSRGSSDMATSENAARPAAAQPGPNAYSDGAGNGPASIQEAAPTGGPPAGGSAAAASTSAAAAPSGSMESSSGSSGVPDEVVPDRPSSGSATVTSSRSDVGGRPVTTALCPLPGLSRAAVEAAVSVVGSPRASEPYTASVPAALCADRALSGQVFVTSDGSRVTVLRDSGTTTTVQLNARSTVDSAGDQIRVVHISTGRLVVSVSTPSASPITDRQLAQIAAAVLTAG